jgi:hypothetical protein
MKIRIAAAAALAGSLIFIPIALENANAAHIGGIGGGGIGGAHFGGGGIGHFGGANIGHFDGGRIGGMGHAHFADVGGMGGGRWRGGSVWHANNWNGNWHATTTSTMTTAASTIGSLVLDGGLPTMATITAMAAVHGCAAKLLLPEAPIGGTGTTAVRTTTDG